MVINETKMSLDGEVIAFVQNYIMGGRASGVPPHRLVVINKNNQTSLAFPEKEDGYLGVTGSLNMSPNGRYISVSGDNKENKSVKFYFDLKNKTTWEAPEEYYATEIEDSGLAQIRWHMDRENRTEYKTIDLKNYLGK